MNSRSPRRGSASTRVRCNATDTRTATEEEPRDYVRHYRHRRSRWRARAHRPAPADDRSHRAPRPRRRRVRARLALRPQGGDGGAGAGRAGPSPARDHRSLRARHPTAQRRRRAHVDRVQRRDLQLSRPEGRAGGARPNIQNRDRHGSPAARLSRVGGQLPRARARHVRVRDLGRAPRRALLRARSPRHQAVLLYDARGLVQLRIRDQGARQLAGPAAHPRRRSRARVSDSHELRLRRADHVPRGQRPPRRPPPTPGPAPPLDDEAPPGFLIPPNRDHGGGTMFREVKAPPGGHSLTLDVRSGRYDVRRYWELTAHGTNGTGDAHKIADLRELLTDAMRRHLISDVRAGSCLSGGIDSSVVVGLVGKVWREHPEAATALGDRFFTFTSCWDDPACAERQYALAAATAAGATPHLVFPTPDDFWETFPKMAWHQDMPFGSFSYYAQWSVMRAARDAGVKVLLDGQGGDEVFGGYAKFRYAYFASLLRSGRLPSLAREVGAAVLQSDNYVLDLRKGFRYLPAPLRRLMGVDTLLKDVLRADWNHSVGAESTPATRWWRY